MAKKIVVANWKMNPPSFREAKKLFEAEKKAAAALARRVTVVIAPPALYLRALASLVRGASTAFAAQNVHWESAGAFTGEMSCLQARDAKAAYALVGHAERRAAGETNDDARKKVAACLGAGLTPVLCIGEAARNAEGAHFDYVREQLRIGTADVPQGKVGKLIVAYEPVWAIGAAAAMKPRDMHEMAIFIRKVLAEAHGEGALSVTILYGGAVDSTNAAAMLEEGDVDGLLVGRASIEAERFRILLNAVAER